MFIFHGTTVAIGQGLVIIKASRTLSDTTPSVELLWISDRPLAETLLDNIQ